MEEEAAAAPNFTAKASYVVPQLRPPRPPASGQFKPSRGGFSGCMAWIYVSDESVILFQAFG